MAWLLNVVLVLMLTNSILGPVLTNRFAPHLLKDASGSNATAYPGVSTSSQLLLDYLVLS